MKLSGWGRYPVYEANVIAPRTVAAMADHIEKGGVIARGNGRAYGDSAVGTKNTLQLRHFNRLLDFDDTNGKLVAEAGALLSDIIDVFLARGWFPSVTPGTKLVTLGGMIAADVHGKNHHQDGSFGNFVDWIDLLCADGEIRRCSRHQNPDLFGWTIGGMGLTGIILRAAIQLRPIESAWIKQTTIVAENVNAAIDVFEKSQDAAYSVAWIDCLSKGEKLGRSLIMLGEHAKASELPDELKTRPFSLNKKKTIDVVFEGSPLLFNKFSVSLFNQLYYLTHRAGTKFVDLDSYFYPLDRVHAWNKMYGRRGFAQFQCVLPLEQSRAGIRALLEKISQAGMGSFLAVLKRLGAQNHNFSFPMPGYTLALDFPISRRSLMLMDALDRIAIEHGGRLYLAKDSRMTAETLRQSDERIPRFSKLREEQSADFHFQSEQSARLKI